MTTNPTTLTHLAATVDAIEALLVERLPPPTPATTDDDPYTPLDTYTVGDLLDELISRFTVLGDQGIIRVAIDGLVLLRDSLPDTALHYRTEYK